MTREPLKLAFIGLGPIGLKALAVALDRPQTMKVVGAADLDKAIVGRDLGAICNRAAINLKVSADFKAMLRAAKPDVVVLCTGSRLADLTPTLAAIIESGADVVTSAEELLHPRFANAQLAADLDAAARAADVSVVGTGVNPGFVMDLVPIMLSQAAARVDRVRVERIVDAATRREPLQRKVGAGLSLEQWRERAATGRFGHVGLKQSIALIGDALGFKLDAIETRAEPVVADRRIQTEFLVVEPGQAAGIRNTGTGKSGGVVRVDLDLAMFVGARDPRDRIQLAGDPPLELIIAGGTPGDIATAAILINTASVLPQARAGLLTVLDLMPACCSALAQDRI